MRGAATPPAAPPPQRQLGRALRRHGWLLVVALAVCGATAAVTARALQPVYQAAATVELDAPAPVVQFPGESSTTPDMGTEPGTVAEELASPALVAAAAAPLGTPLVQHTLRQRHGSRPLPPAELTAAALRQLQILPVAQSRVIQLQFQAPRPELATAFLDHLLGDYQTRAQARARAANLARVSALSQRVDAARAQVRTAQAALAPYSAQGPAPPAAAILAEQRRQQLAQAETAAEIAALRQADQLAAAPAADAAVPLPADLEAKRADLESELRRLSAIYQPGAAPVQQAQQALAGLDASVSSWQSRSQLAAQQNLAAQRQQVSDLNAALAAQGRRQAAITASAAAYDLAARRLQADQDTYSSLLDQLQRAAAEAGSTPAAVRVIAPPAAAPVPLRPNPRQTAAYAVVFGLLVGALGIAGMELVRDRVWLPEAAELGLPVVARLPPAASGVAALPAAAVAHLAAVLTRAQTDAGAGVVLMTSAEPGCGKTTVAQALAAALARPASPVLLVDGHAARPGLHPDGRQDEGAAVPGVSELLAGSASVEQALRRWPGSNPALWYLPAGEPGPGGLVDLASGAAGELLAAARQRYAWIVIDGGPVLEDAAACLWASHADCSLIVAEHGRGCRRRLRQALERLACASTAPAGLVLLRVPEKLPGTTDWLAAAAGASADSNVQAMRRWA